jgi:protein-tyrosine-phosphatase
MDPEMAAQLRARGGEPSGHVSRALTRDLLEETELVLTFEFAHRVRLSDAWPDQAIKVFGLRQFAAALGRVPSPGRGLELLDQVYTAKRPDGLDADVVDPYRRGTAVARACADEIDGLLARVVPALAGQGQRRS